MINSTIRWIAAGGCLVLAGCTTTVPAEPDIQAWIGQGYAETQVQESSDWSDERWWAMWADPVLESLLQQADEANLDNRMAWEKVQEARAGLVQWRSQSLPQIDWQGSVSESESGLPAPVKQGNPDTRAYRLGLQLGWELDIWGGVAASVASASANAQAAEEGWIASRWSVQHEVARNYLIWQGARQRLARMDDLLEIQRQAHAWVVLREREGMVSTIDLAQQEATLEEIGAQRMALISLIQVTEHHLAELLGERPGQRVKSLNHAMSPVIPDTAPMPLGLPVELLLRRPDLRVAERLLQAETARLQVADADMWPKLFLGAVIGGQDLRLNGLDLSPARFTNVAVALTAPLFNAGRLQAAVAQQSAVQRRATLAYEKAVLEALGQVESSLVRSQQNRAIERQLRLVMAAREQAFSRADLLKQEGQIDPLQWLDLKRALLMTQLQHVDAHLNTALSSLQLYQALGGGWLYRSENAVSAAISYPSQRRQP